MMDALAPARKAGVEMQEIVLMTSLAVQRTAATMVPQQTRTTWMVAPVLVRKVGATEIVTRTSYAMPMKIAVATAPPRTRTRATAVHASASLAGKAMIALFR